MQRLRGADFARLFGLDEVDGVGADFGGRRRGRTSGARLGSLGRGEWCGNTDDAGVEGVEVVGGEAEISEASQKVSLSPVVDRLDGFDRRGFAQYRRKM